MSHRTPEKLGPAEHNLVKVTVGIIVAALVTIVLPWWVGLILGTAVVAVWWSVENFESFGRLVGRIVQHLTLRGEGR